MEREIEKQKRSLPVCSDLEERLSKEYRSGYPDFYLSGFGAYRFTESVPESFKDSANPKKDSDKYDTELLMLYSLALAKVEADASNTAEDPEVFIERITTIPSSKDFFINELNKRERWKKYTHPDCIIAWYDDKRRAAIRGFRNSGRNIGADNKYLEAMIKEEFKIYNPKIETNIKNLKTMIKENYASFKKYILLGFAGAALSTIAAISGSWALFYHFADKKEKELKDEVRWELRYEINSARSTIKSDAKDIAWDMVGDVLNQYAPNISPKLPPQERLQVVLEKLEDDKKKELMKTIEGKIQAEGINSLQQLLESSKNK
ncbi:hypothetical protein JW851_00625 [Candidatus Woesearchaeota archaeon]|nr:hypothetical protein [Candidatus Woesearchaeota archaeon]